MCDRAAADKDPPVCEACNQSGDEPVTRHKIGGHVYSLHIDCLIDWLNGWPCRRGRA
jgi:hypothetical protein